MPVQLVKQSVAFETSFVCI